MKQIDTVGKRVSRRPRDNALDIILAPFARHLEADDYAHHTVSTYVGVASHFGRWLKRKGYQVRALNENRIDEFRRVHLPQCRCRRPSDARPKIVQRALRKLLGFLRLRKVCPPLAPRFSILVNDRVRRFDFYLSEVCGLSEATRRYHRRHIQEFLHWRFGRGPLCFQKLRPQDFAGYIHRRARALRPTTVQLLAGSLRSFLRHLELEGKAASNLGKAILSPAAYGLQTLPRSFSGEETRQLLLRGFDRRSPIGRRDYAMALCQLGLGLRACEVATLTLDDLCWPEGALVIRKTKTRRGRRLPLTTVVGRALTAYLRNGRPQSSAREVFLHHIRPVGTPLVSGSVRGAMREAYWRAGLARSWTGTHVLRRTFATRLHQRGAGLKAIADLLGHQSLNTATVYTRVNLSQLRQVALPWPE